MAPETRIWEVLWRQSRDLFHRAVEEKVIFLPGLSLLPLLPRKTPNLRPSFPLCVVITQHLPPPGWCFYLSQVTIVCFPVQLLIQICLCLIWNSALLDGIFTEKCYLYVTLPLHFSRGLMIPRRPVCAESHIRCGWERPFPAMPWLRKSWGLWRDSRILGWPDDAAAVIPQRVEGAARELPWKAAWNLCQASRENPRQMLEQQGQGLVASLACCCCSSSPGAGSVPWWMQEPESLCYTAILL